MTAEGRSSCGFLPTTWRRSVHQQQSRTELWGSNQLNYYPPGWNFTHTFYVCILLYVWVFFLCPVLSVSRRWQKTALWETCWEEVWTCLPVRLVSRPLQFLFDWTLYHSPGVLVLLQQDRASTFQFFYKSSHSLNLIQWMSTLNNIFQSVVMHCTTEED